MTRRLFLTLACFLLISPARADAPKRIVSLSPGTTEMLFALGLGPSVVGDTTFCDFPPAARPIAKIGDVNTNDEKILALRPDLIVADAVANRAAVARLRRLHLPVLAVTVLTFSEVETAIRQIGAKTGQEKEAKKVVADMETKRKTAAKLAKSHAPKKTLIVVGASPLWTAGRETFLDAILTDAGGVNTAKSVVGYAPYSREKVLTNPPDVILADPRAQATLRTDTLLRTLAAVRQSKFVYVTDSNLLLRPGPRLADGLLQLARALAK